MFIFKSNVNVLKVVSKEYNGTIYSKAYCDFENGGMEIVSCPCDLPIGENEFLFVFDNGKVKIL